MSLNQTPSANRVHIAFFGRRNAGKSSLVNAVTGQDLALVSEVKGTTTDPVHKAMELLPVGPVVIIDTPGFDDEGELGEKRIGRTKQVLNKADVAVLVLDGEISPAGTALNTEEEEILNTIKSKNILYMIVRNKYDLNTPNTEAPGETVLPVSAKTGYNINLLKEKIAALALAEEPKRRLVADLIQYNDFVVLVIPIDESAPKGRLILPQQQVIRDILEAGGAAIAVKETELRQVLSELGKKPALVITDSQVFAEVSAIVPPEIPLTSFSILFARYKGFLETAVAGASAIDTLQDGDRVMICEACTHHRQCEDIGTVKIPRMIKNYTKKAPEFIFSSGGDFPQELSSYKLIIHCGSCMLNERETQHRRNLAEEQNIPFTNYGTAIAHINGILARSVAMLGI